MQVMLTRPIHHFHTLPKRPVNILYSSTHFNESRQTINYRGCVTWLAFHILLRPIYHITLSTQIELVPFRTHLIINRMRLMGTKWCWGDVTFLLHSVRSRSCSLELDNSVFSHSNVTMWRHLKGCGMGPWLFLVSRCFRENVVATCKIGPFFV